jgi:hypothetical protein
MPEITKQDHQVERLRAIRLRYHILISALFTDSLAGWHIAALFTTDKNRGEAGR